MTTKRFEEIELLRTIIDKCKEFEQFQVFIQFISRIIEKLESLLQVAYSKCKKKTGKNASKDSYRKHLDRIYENVVKIIGKGTLILANFPRNKLLNFLVENQYYQAFIKIFLELFSTLNNIRIDDHKDMKNYMNEIHQLINRFLSLGEQNKENNEIRKAVMLKMIDRVFIFPETIVNQLRLKGISYPNLDYELIKMVLAEEIVKKEINIQEEWLVDMMEDFYFSVQNQRHNSDDEEIGDDQEEEEDGDDENEDDFSDNEQDREEDSREEALLTNADILKSEKFHGVLEFFFSRIREPGKIPPPESSIRIISDCYDCGRASISHVKGKDAVFLIGNSGSGKSTFINYLLGCTLELMIKSNGNRQLKLVKVKPQIEGGTMDEIVPIGHNMKFETLVPFVYTDLQSPDRVYCDCPGFLGQKGEEIDIANFVNIRDGLVSARTVKIILLVNYIAIKADKNYLPNIAKLLLFLFGSKKKLIENKDSLLIGITFLYDYMPSDTTVTLKSIKKEYSQKNSQEIIKILIDRLFIYDPLDRPVDGIWDQKRCLEEISRLKPVQNASNIFKIILNDPSQRKIVELSQAVKQNVIESLNYREFHQTRVEYNSAKFLTIIDHAAINHLILELKHYIIRYFNRLQNEIKFLAMLERFPDVEHDFLIFENGYELFFDELHGKLCIEPIELNKFIQKSKLAYITRQERNENALREMKNLKEKIEYLEKMYKEDQEKSSATFDLINTNFKNEIDELNKRVKFELEKSYGGDLGDLSKNLDVKFFEQLEENGNVSKDEVIRLIIQERKILIEDRNKLVEEVNNVQSQIFTKYQKNIELLKNEVRSKERELNGYIDKLDPEAIMLKLVTSEQKEISVKYDMSRNGDANALQYLEERLSDPLAQGYLGILYYIGELQRIDKKKIPEFLNNAAPWLVETANKKNNPFSQYIVGFMYKNGLYFGKDMNQAFAYFKMSAESGYSYGQCALGVCFKNGEGVIKDIKTAMDYFRQSAHQGNSVSKFFLGTIYLRGDVDVPPDPKEAVNLFKSSSQLGYSNAKCYLGVCYSKGLGVDKDQAEAVKYYIEGSKQKNSYALCNLGVCYKNGLGIPKDPRKAVKHFILSANKGNSYAQYNLALCFLKGECLKQSYEEAFRYFKNSADQGNPLAQNSLGICHFKGEGTSINYKEAAKYFKLSADQYNMEALFHLGLCYQNGKGVSQNLKEAFKCFKLSADLGSDRAQYNVAICYKNGEGTEQDFGKAQYYYELSASHGNIFAQNNLGLFFHSDRYVLQDLKKSIHFFKLSADTGNSNAQYNMGFCYEEGKGVPIDLKESFKYYKMSAEQGNHFGQFKLADCYLKGKGVKQDYKLAYQYLKASSEQGNMIAKFRLDSLMLFANNKNI